MNNLPKDFMTGLGRENDFLSWEVFQQALKNVEEIKALHKR